MNEPATQEIITPDGEVVVENLPAVIDSQTLSVIERAQIDTQIATAHAYPRSIKQAMSNILSLATLDEQTAVECIYAIKRGSKPLRGPSIRLAEIIAQAWRNNRVEARVVQIDRTNKVIVAEGTFVDLEGNTAVRASVQRRISDKHGRLYSDDMIAVTGNAACSIARRNAILAGVPKGVWRRAQEEAERVIKGDVKTLAERRDQAIKALAHFGLSPEQVFTVLDVKGLEDIDLDDLVTLRVIYTSLKNGEQTVEELLRGGAKPAPHHAPMANPLKDDEPASDDQKPAGGDAQAGGDQPVGDAGKPEGEQAPPPTEETISEARKRGREARAAGHQRKAMPAEYRDPARKTEADEWRKGYDETPAPAVTDKTAEG